MDLLKNILWKIPIALILLYLLRVVLFCPCDKLLSCKSHVYVLAASGVAIATLVGIQHWSHSAQ